MHRAFAALFLAVALVVPAWTSQAQSPEELVRTALEAEDRGQLSEAIELHKAVVAAQPDNVRSLNSIAGLYGKQGQYREEITWAKKALAIDAGYSPAWVNLGTAHLALAELPQAEAAYSKGVAANPRYPVAHYHLGVAHEEMGDFPAAEKNYEDAIAADTKFEVAYYNLGALTARQGRFDEASTWLNRLLEINPSHAEARTMLQHIEAERAKQAVPRTQAQPTSLAGRTPFAAGQSWRGKYLCGQGITELDLRITDVEGQRVTAVFDFTVSPQVSGQFQIHGEYQPSMLRIAFRPGDWISQPTGYTAVGLLGHVDPGGNVMSGVVDELGCGSFAVMKYDD